jgi:hypothetical protein
LATLLCLLWQVRKFLASKEEAGLTEGEEIRNPYLSVENDVFFFVLVHLKIFLLLLLLWSLSCTPVMMMHGAMTEEDCAIVQAHMMQMTFVVNPQFHQELSYLNKDERLLRWMMIRNRGNVWTKIGKD